MSASAAAELARRDAEVLAALTEENAGEYGDPMARAVRESKIVGRAAAAARLARVPLPVPPASMAS
jgi:hypothetical protein